MQRPTELASLLVGIDDTSNRRAAVLKTATNLEMVIETICIGKSSKKSLGLLRIYIDNTAPQVIVDDTTPFEAASEARVERSFSSNVLVLHVEMMTPPNVQYKQCSGAVCFQQKHKADRSLPEVVENKHLWFLYGHSRHIVHEYVNPQKRQRTNGDTVRLPASWLEIPFKVCHQVHTGWFRVTLSSGEHSVSGDTNAFSNYDRRKIQEVAKQPKVDSVQSLTREEAISKEWAVAMASALGREHASALKQHPARTRPYYLQGTVDRLDQLIEVSDRPENKSLIDLNELSARVRWLENEIAKLPQDSRVLCKYNVRYDKMSVNKTTYEIYDFNANPIESDHCEGWHDPISVLARWCFLTRMPYEYIFGSILWPYIQARFPEQNPDPRDNHLWLTLAATNCDYYCYFTLLSNFGDPNIIDMCERLIDDQLRLRDMPRLTYDIASPFASESSSVAAERASMSPFPIMDAQWEQFPTHNSTAEEVVEFFSPEHES